jgi:hypothetical protein
MGWTSGAHLVALLLFPATADLGWSPSAPNLHVLVRVHDSASVDEKTRDSALGVAEEILSAAGITVSWHRCDLESHNPASCSVPLSAEERVIQFMRSAIDTRTWDHLPLGEAVIDPVRKFGALARVYADRIRWKADETRFKADVLLGRAIAHEVGHLLLGTTRHSATGLMRAFWSTDELLRGQRADWTFTAADSALIRANCCRAMTSNVVESAGRYTR